jgi:hypothetical protein
VQRHRFAVHNGTRSAFTDFVQAMLFTADWVAHAGHRFAEGQEMALQNFATKGLQRITDTH